jgi:tripartite-type tricarboxylate transporter receptor subunit TctC
MKPIKKNLLRYGAMALFGSLVLGNQAHADQFPTQPVRLVIPYPPGGALSVTGAIVATAAEDHLGQPMLSLNRAGGGGVVGATFVANSKPDGYTLLLGDPTINVIRPELEKLPYKIDDFVPVARLTHSPFVFVAAKDAPFSTVQEMVAFAKSNPNKLVYSSDNKNGWTYTAFEILKKATGVEMRGVEFDGGGPAITNVLGGNTMAYAGVPSVVQDHIKSGTLKALCVSDKERYKPLPEIPTCAEEGVDINWGAWIGVFAPKKTPETHIAKLRQTFQDLAKDPGFQALTNRINADLNYLDTPEFSALLDADIKAVR